MRIETRGTAALCTGGLCVRAAALCIAAALAPHYGSVSRRVRAAAICPAAALCTTAPVLRLAKRARARGYPPLNSVCRATRID